MLLYLNFENLHESILSVTVRSRNFEDHDRDRLFLNAIFQLLTLLVFGFLFLASDTHEIFYFSPWYS